MDNYTNKNPSLKTLGEQIQNQQLDPRQLVRDFLDGIDRDEDKDKIFIDIYREEACQASEAAYQRMKSGQRLSLYDGIPIVWKDNFEIKDKPTTAGLRIFHNRIASKNATVYQTATDAGLVCLGKTNMTELAFSGLGINPTFGTPRNPFDPHQRRVPGGSSSGSAVAVAKRLCCASIGTDTGGSIRTPAAWNSLVGLKTTAKLLPMDGVIPLSQTLDTIGFLTHSIEDATSLYHIFTRTQPEDRTHKHLEQLELLVCTTTVWDRIDNEVAKPIETFLEQLSGHGVKIDRQPIPEITRVLELIDTYGNIVSYEASENWLKFLDTNPGCISTDILDRFRLGSKLTDANIQIVRQGLQEIQHSYVQQTSRYHAVLMPTVVNLPPIINELEQDSQKYNLENLLSLRNTRLVNLLGLCALSLPIGMTESGLPVGLMIVSPPFTEKNLLQVGKKLENIAANS